VEAITREIATLCRHWDDLLGSSVSLQMSDNCQLNRELIRLATRRHIHRHNKLLLQPLLLLLLLMMMMMMMS